MEGNWHGAGHEEAAYRTLGHLIGSFGPKYLGSVVGDGWHLLLLEDISRATRVPPWTPELAFEAVRDIAAFHLHGTRAAAGSLQTQERQGLADN